MSEIDLSKVDEIVKELGGGPEQTIPILQRIQEEFRYLPKEALKRVCEITEITPAQIYGVATFYAQFRLEPVGKYIIKVCHGTACHVGGAVSITETLEDALGIKTGETTPDGLFTLESVACLGACSLAPIVVIEGETYGKLDPNKALKIVEEYRARENQGG